MLLMPVLPTKLILDENIKLGLKQKFSSSEINLSLNWV